MHESIFSALRPSWFRPPVVSPTTTTAAATPDPSPSLWEQLQGWTSAAPIVACALSTISLSLALASHPSGPHHISIDPLHTKPIHPTLPTSDSLITDFTLLCPSRYFTPSPRPQHEEPLPAHPPAPAPRRPPVGLGWVQGSPLPLPLLGEIQQAAVFCFAGGNYASKPNKLILQCISGNRWSSTNKLIRQRHKN